MAQKPSEMLKSLATTFETSVYLQIVETHINPFLDSLPSKETAELVSVIEKAHKEYSGVAQIAYSGTERRLKADLKALEDHVKNNCYSYETQVRHQARSSSQYSGLLIFLSVRNDGLYRPENR